MKPLTAAEIRDEIAKFPTEPRGLVTALCYSAFDQGITVGLANGARSLNPFSSVLPPPMPKVAPRGKAR